MRKSGERGERIELATLIAKAHHKPADLDDDWKAHQAALADVVADETPVAVLRDRVESIMAAMQFAERVERRKARNV